MNLPAPKPIASPVTSEWGSKSHIHTLLMMTATAFGVYLCYRMASPFLPAIAWALALAVVFTRFQRWLESKIKPVSLAAAISVLVIGLMVVVPVAFVLQNLFVQAAKGAEMIESKVTSGEWRRAIKAQPRLAPLLEKIERQTDLPGAVKTLATWLSNTAGSIVKGSVFQAIDFCLTLYLLFFFLRDGRLAVRSLRSLSPLSKAEMDSLIRRVSDTIHATIYGTLAVSAVQGVLGGLMFWWLGLSTPLLWGVMMGLLAVVPVLGAFVIWIPAALFLALEGSWGKALILTVWGMLAVGTIDNLLAPVLVGNRLKLHTLLAFISVVGGLLFFGPAGIILGPIALTVTTALLEIWSGRAAVDTVGRVEPDDLSRLESEGGPVTFEPGGRRF